MVVPFMYFQLMINFLLHCFCFHKTVICTSTDPLSFSGSAPPPLVQYSPCHPDERSALLQFKQTFSINESASVDPSAHHKVESWKPTDQGESNNCCSWDGVECDEFTGHVIGLDLSSSFLHGSINSSNSLFSLLHLQSLNLADNDFNHSQIPSEIGHLSALTILNLSNSRFSGQIPPSISKLSKLVSLDLSSDLDIDGSPLLRLEKSFTSLVDLSSNVDDLPDSRQLKLEKSDFTCLIQNLTNLIKLCLGQVRISSQVPQILANLTFLTTLSLRECELYGKFPAGLFHLPKLQVLSLSYNKYLTGHLPEFNRSTRLEILSLASTSFSGKLPNSFKNLNFLRVLDFEKCNFQGSLAASLNNLTHVTYMNLDSNKFTGDIPSLGGLSQLKTLILSWNEFNFGTLPWIGELTEVNHLELNGINLYGSILSSLTNLTHLTHLLLDENQLTGKIPPRLMNLTQLIMLGLSSNQLHGPIPSTFSGLKKLRYFFVFFNNLSGTVEMDIFLNLKSLVILELGLNKLTVRTKNNTNATFPQFQMLGLSSCNLGRFPHFLHSQHELEVLELNDNQIHGKIPTWFLNTTQEKLHILALDYNFLTGFDQRLELLPWANLGYVSLGYNLLQGPLQMPAQSTFYYDVSHNRLRGEIPPLICGLISLCVLDLSNNNLSGTIPPCLSNFSDSLSILNLKGNKFHGPIPQAYNRGNKLKMIDFSQNQLQGNVPRSLTSCTVLQFLDLSNNMIEDTFPFWLGALTELQVLILRSNKFYGAVSESRTKSEFSNLRIIDLSQNGFTGSLPAKYFKFWNAMKNFNLAQQRYLQVSVFYQLQNQFPWEQCYLYSMAISNKGVKREYEKIQNLFTAVDLSSNKFEWEIPKSIGSLTALQLLNLSNNNLSGGIPLSLGNLTNLESLDLSQNKLSGEIPQVLAQLTFLEVFNVSHNNLTGLIPTGKQFDTFENNSYGGNVALCGGPLSRKCENLEAQPKPPVNSERREDSAFPNTTVDWIVISLGYGSGIIVGVVIGQTLTTRYQDWFLETFGRKKQKKQRKKKRMREGNRR